MKHKIRAILAALGLAVATTAGVMVTDTGVASANTLLGSFPLAGGGSVYCYLDYIGLQSNGADNSLSCEQYYSDGSYNRNALYVQFSGSICDSWGIIWGGGVNNTLVYGRNTGGSDFAHFGCGKGDYQSWTTGLRKAYDADPSSSQKYGAALQASLIGSNETCYGGYTCPGPGSQLNFYFPA